MLSKVNPLGRLRDRLSALDSGTAQLHRRDEEQMRRMDKMTKRIDRQTARIAELEAEVQEGRELGMRVAQLSDIVQELLLPVVDRDEERLHQLLQKYATTL